MSESPAVDPIPDSENAPEIEIPEPAPEPSGRVLLDRASLGAVAFASPEKSGRYALIGINVTPTAVEATDGHVCITIPHVGIDANEFPALANPGGAIPQAGIMMPADTAKAALKALPKKTGGFAVLGYAQVGIAEDGAAVATVTDLASSQRFTGKLHGPFPSLAQVTPERKGQRITLNAHLVARLAAFAVAHGGGRLPEVNLWVRGEGDGLRFEIPIDGWDRVAVGAIMPMRSSDPDPERGKS